MDYVATEVESQVIELHRSLQSISRHSDVANHHSFPQTRAVRLRRRAAAADILLIGAPAPPPPPTECRRRAGAVFVTCLRHVVHQLYVARFCNAVYN